MTNIVNIMETGHHMTTVKLIVVGAITIIKIIMIRARLIKIIIIIIKKLLLCQYSRIESRSVVQLVHGLGKLIVKYNAKFINK